MVDVRRMVRALQGRPRDMAPWRGVVILPDGGLVDGDEAARAAKATVASDHSPFGAPRRRAAQLPGGLSRQADFHASKPATSRTTSLVAKRAAALEASSIVKSTAPS